VEECFRKLKLWELSLATFPMNESATVLDMKSLDQMEGVLRGVKPSEVDGEMLVCLRTIAGQVKRLLAIQRDMSERRRSALKNWKP
jgi:hypothetical protein